MAGSRPDHCRRQFQPLADPARRARHPPVHRHGLWLQRVLVAAVACAGRGAGPGLCTGHLDLGIPVHHVLRLDGKDAGLHLFAVLRAAGFFRRAVRALARNRGSSQGRCGVGAVLVGRAAAGRAGCAPAPAVAAVAGLRRHRRVWSGPRLHLARLHAHKVVSRSAWHGHRSCHHGVRRRCDDRFAARGPAGRQSAGLLRRRRPRSSRPRGM